MWVCTKCGEQIEDQFAACWNCGTTIDGSPIFTRPKSEDDNKTPPGAGSHHVTNYLMEAVLVTLFCCVPFGIAAIFYAGMAKGKLEAGDYEGASEAAKKAKYWCQVSFFLGLSGAALYFLAYWAG
ncbi:MAG: CD225/dispanin family protein [Planctomycetota bacterium]|jgi:hypothetical protein